MSFAACSNNVLRRLLCAAALCAVVVTVAVAQGKSPALQHKIEQFREARAANKRALLPYTWMETIQVSMNGQVRTTKQESCSYGPDGKVVRTPVGSQPQASPRRGLRARIAAQKTEEFKDHMAQVKALMSLYVPPSGTKMKQCFEAGRAMMPPAPAAGQMALGFTDYAIPGDRVTVVFQQTTHKIVSYNVSTFMGAERAPVTLAVRFASLPDGTEHVDQTTVATQARKNIQVTITNSNYRKAGGM